MNFNSELALELQLKDTIKYGYRFIIRLTDNSNVIEGKYNDKGPDDNPYQIIITADNKPNQDIILNRFDEKNIINIIRELVGNSEIQAIYSFREWN